MIVEKVFSYSSHGECIVGDQGECILALKGTSTCTLYMKGSL